MRIPSFRMENRSKVLPNNSSKSIFIPVHNMQFECRSCIHYLWPRVTWWDPRTGWTCRKTKMHCCKPETAAILLTWNSPLLLFEFLLRVCKIKFYFMPNVLVWRTFWRPYMTVCNRILSLGIILRRKLTWAPFKDSVHTTRETYSTSVTQTNQSVLYREKKSLVVLRSIQNTEMDSIDRRQGFWKLNLVVHKVTTRLLIIDE